MNGRLLRSVLTLMLGSGLAQGLALAFAPVLTRLYSPEDYAAITLFMALAGMLLPFACGKYEVAIVVAGTDRQASHLTALSFLVATAVCFVIGLPSIFAWESTNSLLGSSELGRWLMAVPVAVLFSAWAMAGRYVANRRSAYRLISQYLLVQAILSVGLNTLLGFLSWGSNGLIVANLCAVGSGTGWLLWRLRSEMSNACRTTWLELRTVAHVYREFPLYNASSTVLDALTLAMPVFFIARMMSQETLGQYGFMMRIAQAPLSLIGGAVTQVHLKHLSDLVRTRQSATPYLRRITALLATIVIPPSLVLMLVAPDLFAFAFGAPWRRAGELLVIMMPSIAVQFVVSALSPACGATGRNRLGAAWKVLAFVATLGMFVALGSRGESVTTFFVLSTMNVGLYAVYYACIWYAVRHPRLVA